MRKRIACTTAALLIGLCACQDPTTGGPAPPGSPAPDLAASAAPDLAAPTSPPPPDDGPQPRDDDPEIIGAYIDFPPTPRIDPGLPSDIAERFGAPGPFEEPTGQPCLTEPPLDALYPRNWSPPLFEWSTASQMDVFELRVHIANQQHDLVVYTGARWFSMSADTWASVAEHSAGFNMSITVRGARLAGAALAAPAVLGSAGNVHIAPAEAPGDIVYWSTSGAGALQRLRIGEQRPKTVLTPELLQDGSHCIGCHATSPDGKLLFVSRNRVADGPFGVVVRSADGSGGGALAGSVSLAAQALLARPNQTLPALSPAHFGPRDAVALTTLSDESTGGRFEIVWTDLHAAAEGPGASGVLRRDGDGGEAATPTFSEDGRTVAYASSAGVTDGRTRGQPSDIYTVPYGDRGGGAARPLPGASEAGYSEYYPAFSPGDRMLAFNRVLAGTNTYHEPSAEIFVVPAAGGAPIRVAGNRPAACGGQRSPGLTNSWPRWAPSATRIGDRRYYWLVFSSTRRGLAPQLFISGVVTEIDGAEERLWKTYPAVYLSGQSPFDGNHTPTWTGAGED